MLPSRHIIASVPLGLTVGLLTESLIAGLLCFFSGVLIDIDHIIDYIIHYGLKGFSFKQTYRACKKFAEREEEGGLKKIYLILHVWEMAILFWVSFLFTKNICLLAIALGYSGHLILDASNNIMKPSSYFIILRIKHDFRTIKLLNPHPHQDS